MYMDVTTDSITVLLLFMNSNTNSLVIRLVLDLAKLFVHFISFNDLLVY
jgi:hypothetical protein